MRRATGLFTLSFSSSDSTIDFGSSVVPSKIFLKKKDGVDSRLRSGFSTFDCSMFAYSRGYSRFLYSLGL
jgi:hypothetical protein